MEFVTWNVNVRESSASSLASKAEYLAAVEWDVAALQEVSPKMAGVLRELAGSMVYLADPGDRYGSALLARNGVTLEDAGVVPDLPVPSRGVAAEIQIQGRSVTVGSWHPPNAAKRVDKPAKQAAYTAFNRWACSRAQPLLVGADANHGALWTRIADFPDSAFRLDFPRDLHWDENVFWTSPEHDLRDAWMIYLDANPAVLTEVRAEWERLKPDAEVPEPGEGRASAVTHVRGQGKPGEVHDRFDYVLMSPELRVIEMSHDLEGAVNAGSDHALVRACVHLAE